MVGSKIERAGEFTRPRERAAVVAVRDIILALECGQGGWVGAVCVAGKDGDGWKERSPCNTASPHSSGGGGGSNSW